MFGIARNFRATHGDAKFSALAKVVFTDADENRSGSIDSEEVGALMKRLGMLLTAEQTKTVLRHYDADGSGELSEAEWLGLVSDLVDGSFEDVNQLSVESERKSLQSFRAGPAIALRTKGNGPKASTVLAADEFQTLDPAALAALLRQPGNPERLVASVEAARVSGSALAMLLRGGSPTSATSATSTGAPLAPSALPPASASAAVSAAGKAAAAAGSCGVSSADEESGSERDALTAQFRAWGQPSSGPALAAFRRWGSDQPLSSWSSLVLDLSGRVSKLVGINGVNLGSAPLLPTFGALRALVSIQIFYCNLRGGLEPLAGCVALQQLHMSSNELDGDLAPLRELTKLEYIKLNDNLLTGTLEPLTRCTALHTLIVSGNRLEGSLGGLAGMEALDTLDLGVNRFACTLAPLQSCAALRVLLLNGNQQLQATLTNLYGLAKIEKIDLQGTNAKASQEDFRHFGHKLLADAKPYEAPAEAPHELDKAASTLQAHVRGKAGRKRTKSKVSA